MKDKKLKDKIPNKFLIKRITCGLCKDGIKFQFAFKFYHKSNGAKIYFSYICKKCTPTREQLIFVSLNFNTDDMPRYYTYHNYYP